MDCWSRKITIEIIKKIPADCIGIGVSSCLLGLNVKYSGGNNYTELIAGLVRLGYFIPIPICPESFGGLASPRVPAEIVSSGKSQLQILNRIGEDVTAQFSKGAEQTLQLMQLIGIKTAILKSGSPSCGISEVYDGSFSGKKVKGSGVAAALLGTNGIRLICSEKFANVKKGFYTGLCDEYYQSIDLIPSNIIQENGCFNVF